MVKAAIGQLCSTGVILNNLRICESLVKKAAAAGASALFLPEAADYISATAAESSRLSRSPEAGAFVRGMQQAAFQAGIEVSVGVHEPAETDQRVKNILLWIDKGGNITQRYQKLHLFDVNIEGGPVIEESMSAQRGTNLVAPFPTSIGSVGLLICYDLRFPEAGLALRRLNSQIITYPSAFSIPTGRAHWRPLLQARAIELQSYVIAAAQAGQHNESRASYGHGMIVDPWGVVVAELDDGPEPAIVSTDIDLERLEKIRREMPLVRRYDVYPEMKTGLGSDG